jgi:hypothetical protein
MAEQRVSVLKFSGDEDDFCIWIAMQIRAEPNLPAREGPGNMADEIAAVERNDKAVAFLMAAMPDAQAVTLLVAGKADPNWPNCLKAHLMTAYLKNTFAAATILSRVGTKRDLESCVMCKDEHPKILFEQLMGVQLKYAGNVQVQVVEGDLVTQAI